MTIRLMLRVVFGFTIGASCLLMLITLMLKNSLHDSEEAANARFEQTNLAKMASVNSANLTSLARQYVVTLNPDYLKSYNTLVEQVQGKTPWPDGQRIAYLDRLKKAGIGKNELSVLEKSTQRSLQLVKTEMEAFSMVEPMAGKAIPSLSAEQHLWRNQAIDLLHNNDYQAVKKTIEAPVHEFIDMIGKNSLEEVTATQDKVAFISTTSTLIISLIILALILCYIRLESRVIKTIQHLVSEAQRISGGDLSKEIKLHGKDEMSQLANNFNIMSVQLADLLREITKQSEHAQFSSRELEKIARDASRLNDEQNEAIESISSSVYENSVAVKEVAQSCSEAAESATTVEQRTTEGGQVIKLGLDAIQSVANVMRESIERLVDLENSVSDVTAILNVISDIAEQTNLLALNAAIEAARAGEQGRGFAVVADEVRTLASRTQISTIEIKEKINSLEQVSKSVTASIHSSDQSVGQAVKNSEQISEMLNSITTLAQGILDMNQSIAAASAEQSMVTGDIAERLTKIRDGSVESKAQAHELSNSSNKLSSIALVLTEQVKRFVLP